MSKKSKDEVPRYFTVDYMTQLLQRKITVPQQPDPGDIKPIANVSSYEIYKEIETFL